MFIVFEDNPIESFRPDIISRDFQSDAIPDFSPQMRDINADTTTAAIAGSADAAAAAAASAAAASIPSLKHTGDLGGDAGEGSEKKQEEHALFCTKYPAERFWARF